GVLRIERNDAGEDARDLLRRVELARLLAGARRKLTDEILVGIAEKIAIRGKLRKPLVDGLDDDAQPVVALLVGLAELFGVQIDLRKEPLEAAGERLVFDELEAPLQSVEQLAVLGAGHLGDCTPQIFGLDDV